MARDIRAIFLRIRKSADLNGYADCADFCLRQKIFLRKI